jgi:hypothetical protein
MTKKLYTDMTRVTLVLMHLNSILDRALQQNLSKEEFFEAKEAIENLSGIHESHPSQKNVLAPFVEVFSQDMEAWLNKKKNGDILFHYVQILNGEKKAAHTGRYENVNGSAKHLPSWCARISEAAKSFLNGNLKLDEKEKEKISSLFRSIPADTLMGLVSHLFLRELFHATSKKDYLERLGRFLAGEAPLDCSLNIQSTYVWLEC